MEAQRGHRRRQWPRWVESEPWWGAALWHAQRTLAPQEGSSIAGGFLHLLGVGGQEGDAGMGSVNLHPAPAQGEVGSRAVLGRMVPTRALPGPGSAFAVLRRAELLQSAAGASPSLVGVSTDFSSIWEQRSAGSLRSLSLPPSTIVWHRPNPSFHTGIAS